MAVADTGLFRYRIVPYAPQTGVLTSVSDMPKTRPACSLPSAVGGAARLIRGLQ